MKSRNIFLGVSIVFLLFGGLNITRVYAACPPDCPDAPSVGKPDAASIPCTNCDDGGIKLNIRLKNPLKVDTIPEAIKLFMNAIVKIAIPFIVLAFIWSGLSFILAQGNPTKLQKARNMLLYTMIGTLLILGAWTLTNAIVGTINSIAG